MIFKDDIDPVQTFFLKVHNDCIDDGKPMILSALSEDLVV